MGGDLKDPPFQEDDAATPLTPEEREELIPTHITSRDELNEVEQIGIAETDSWAFTRSRGDILDESLLMTLHKRMFGQVWKWAGAFRTTDRNIGVEPYRIETDLRQLLDDVRFWIEHQTYPPDEIVARFHHRLVWIHPFPNGNGRHARLAADVLAVRLGVQRFTWGSEGLVEPGDVRRRYIEALRAADRHDYSPLLAFVRS